MIEHSTEVAQGNRFEFGKNWSRFLRVLNDERIAEAERSVLNLLGMNTLEGKSFLDVGSGSGLFSLAARRLGAQVHSLDYDPHSVACTAEFRRRFFPDDAGWTVEEGSVLDEAYIRSLGQFDIVYSWGVLHHTGAMWKALEHATLPVRPGGLLFVSIYNEQPFLSRYWTLVKRTYNRAPGFVRTGMNLGYYAYFAGILFVADALRGRNPMARHATGSRRGMSMYHDVVDWIGGYPFEVASPEAIFRFFRDRGFVMREMTTCAGKHGCNQFVFERNG